MSFRADREVRATAERITPTMAQIKGSCTLKKDNKAAARASNINPRQVIRELAQAFPALGCRAALWDGLL